MLEASLALFTLTATQNNCQTDSMYLVFFVQHVITFQKKGLMKAVAENKITTWEYELQSFYPYNT